ncbi:sigma-54 interaction domain-containing protein [Desulfonema magnum]|uniref:Transcriptional regulator, sigma54-dependent n=1 Tax=Desulfonema magnum TaxID=45655 RepID=A0A975BYE7_9BACT|nr:sigma 54-interacting transcriptional regulator [Desulfonema magnum]QTA93543.1 Transcriptional regulator, sigma54-dependent [Desulfonema magnum]
MSTQKNKKKHTDKSVPSDPTTIILESISDGVFTVDSDWRITSFNRAAEEITSILREEAIGRHCSEVFRASMCETDCALRRTMDTGTPIINRSAFIVDAEGRRIPISVSTALLRDENGNIVGGVETFRDLSLVEELRKELEGRFQMGDLISRSVSMREIFDILPQVAASDSTVLIQGETGTGKELVARAIHNLSPRQNKPFVAVNCGALPDTLLESELFGYKAGAFTGANKDKPGRFELARGGTLFLDEIGEITPALQVRLLRVLQEKIFEPLGGTASVTADVRIITATNKDIAAHVKNNNFRQDLFYRINVVRIDLPPLRKRKEDIPMLAEHFVTRFNRLQDKSLSGVSSEVLARLMAHDFPGNIRELENIIEYAFVLCREGEIECCHLPGDFIASNPRTPGPDDIKNTVRAMEAQTILDALKRNNNNRIATARDLGIHKSTLFRKIKSLGLSLPKKDGRSRK